MNIEEILNKLVEFKELPTYQFERRIDAFMLQYLQEAIKSRFHIDDDDFKFIYPEFPLKRYNKKLILKEGKVDRLSEYADYLLWSPKNKVIYLVEFKTEIKSIKEEQFKNYLENCKNGWKTLIEYYFNKINKGNWKKFVHGILRLEKESPELLGNNHNTELKQFIKKSKGVHDKLKNFREKIEFEKQQLPKVHFVYLAPEKADKKLQKYVNTHQGCTEYYKGLMTLNEFAVFAEEPLKSILFEIEKDKKNDESLE